MYTYIKSNIKNNYITLEEELPSELYEIGETFQDFLDGKWVLLSNEQVTFHNEHPRASVSEVWNMNIAPMPERTVEDAKREMLRRIKDYDTSISVNRFDIKSNGEIITSDWLKPEKRANYKNSIDSAELVGLTELSLYIGEMPVTLPVQTAKLMLAQIQLYADQCFIVTKQHLSEVEAMETIEDVDNFPYTIGYPNKLVFEI